MTSTENITLRSAARSNTGLVRKNNQDSGYAGSSFLLVADGMGGHAGGDVASAITVARLADLDTPDQGSDALDVLRSSILDANERITNCVIEKPELAGMGTTVTALLRTGNRLALAHIGDSRAYVMRDGDLSLVTHDHTFVQILVDEGRITPEEAETHPQRSVVMRVLGDVGASPELDLSFRDTLPGDRWMLCSDGLTGFASIEDIEDALRTITDPAACCDRLVELALAGGGADNVTVIVADVLPEASGQEDQVGAEVGSVRINPQFAEIGRSSTPTELVPTGPLDIIDDSADTSPIDIGGGAAHGGPAGGTIGTGSASGTGDTAEIPTGQASSDATTPGSGSSASSGSGSSDTGSDSSDAQSRTATDAATRTDTMDDEFSGWGEDEPRRRRPLISLLITLLVLAAVVIAGVVGWNVLRGQYYLGIDEGNVAVYRGIAQTLGPIELSSLEETTDIQADLLSEFSQNRLEATIPADDREAADSVVEMLREEAASNSEAAAMQGGATDAGDTDDPAPEESGAPTSSPANASPANASPANASPASQRSPDSQRSAAGER